MIDSKLWAAFSKYIRLRDSDNNGLCKCITCHRIAHWKNMDCGHGIPRQHWATRYNEKNNNAQCKVCNGFEGGKREVYKEEVNKKYGNGTWEILEVMSKKIIKRPSKYEISVMESFYKNKAKELLDTKN